MPDVIAPLESELADVRKQLAGYDELREREQRLSAALAVLRGDAMPGEGRARSRSRGRGGSVDQEQIIAALRKSNNQSATTLIDQLSPRPSSNTLSRVLKQMVDEGRLTKTGERRATRYRLAKP